MSEQAYQVPAHWTPTRPCPLEKSDWVMEKSVQHPLLGRVKECYWDIVSRDWVMDVVLYSPDGERKGRESPACGGPRHFEPALNIEHWDRIEKPQFPMSRDGTGYRDWREAATVIPMRD